MWREADSRLEGCSRPVSLVEDLPAATPAVQSGALVSLTCARTASAATGSAAASDARSHTPGKAAAGGWQSVPGAPLPAMPATLLDLTYSDPEAWAPTWGQYAMNTGCARLVVAQKSVQI